MRDGSYGNTPNIDPLPAPTGTGSALWLVAPVQRTGGWRIRESVAPRFLTASNGLGIYGAMYENWWRSLV